MGYEADPSIYEMIYMQGVFNIYVVLSTLFMRQHHDSENRYWLQELICCSLQWIYYTWVFCYGFFHRRHYRRLLN